MEILENKDEEDAFYTHDSNRSVAIVWATIVENRLTAVLLAAMRKDDKMSNELFNPSAPLGNFGTKIRVAYMLGIIDDSMGDLLIINKIRNAFAHRVDIKDFESQPVKDWMSNLKAVKVHLDLLETYKVRLKTRTAIDPEEGKSKPRMEDIIFTLETELMNNRNRYHMCIRYLIHALVTIENKIIASGHIFCTKSPDEEPSSSP